MSKKFNSNRPLNVLYEDDHFVAFFKPAGLLSVSTDKGKEAETLEARANKDYSARSGAAGLTGAGTAPSLPSTQSGTAPKLHPCHRLDRDTSGVILFAKGHRAEELMMELFKQKLVKKKYIAFVHGRLQRPKGEIRSRLEEDKFSKDPDKISVTRYTLRKQHRQFAEVEVEPLTGRTNQIRIHFSHELGQPLVGENKFMFRKDVDLKFKRTALHAWELYFKHPITGVPVSITAPLAVDMQNFLDKNSR